MPDKHRNIFDIAFLQERGVQLPYAARRAHPYNAVEALRCATALVSAAVRRVKPEASRQPDRGPDGR